MMNGWICLHRDIQKHWIWQDPVKLKWWLDMLLSANHEDKKVNIGMQLIDCKRGQCVMSLSSWAKRWCVSKDSTRNFFTLLKNDKMIDTENLTKTTRITICNYGTYQDVLHGSRPQSKRKPNASRTQADPNNNYNNYNNKESTNVDKKKEDIFSHSQDYQKFINWVKENAPYCHEKLTPISEEELSKLKEKYTATQISDVIAKIDNNKKYRKNYVSLYRTVLNWIKKEYGE